MKAYVFLQQRALEEENITHISCHASLLMKRFQIHSLLKSPTCNFPLYSLNAFIAKFFCHLHYFSSAKRQAHSKECNIHNDIFEKVGGGF
jgi:hypothetical protein